MEEKKVDKVVVADLSSGDLNKQLQAVELVRQQGSVLYLSLLADLYVESSFEDVKEQISKLFQDIIDTKAGSVIIEILKETSNSELRSMLLTACWASRIDYSPFVLDIVKLAVEHDYLVAFESLTIVENFDVSPEKSVLDQSLKVIEGAVLDEMTPKAEILRELAAALRRLQ